MKIKTVFAWMSLLAASAVSAQEGGWMVRASAVQVKMQNNAGEGLGWSVDKQSLTVLGVSYFLNKNVAVELLWPSTQTYSVTAAGVNKGALGVSPHALLLQYHLVDWGRVQPYAGAGVNNTQYSGANFVNSENVDRSSWGAALQVGVNFALDRNWSMHVDMKKIYAQTDVERNGAQQGTLKLNPTLTGVGVGYRF